MGDNSNATIGLPPPPISPDVDLRDFAFMPLDVQRLRDSDLGVVCSDAEIRAALWLWCAAWHQVPAGSLPDDCRALAALAGVGRGPEAIQRWREISDGALRGFVRCSDGRLYHLVICEKAAEAWNDKTRFRERREAFRQQQAQRAKAGWSKRRQHAEAMPTASTRHADGINPASDPASPQIMPMKGTGDRGQWILEERDKSLSPSSLDAMDGSAGSPAPEIRPLDGGNDPGGDQGSGEGSSPHQSQDFRPQRRSLTYPEPFLSGFWAIYPRPVGKLDAANAWRVAVQRAGGGAEGQERIRIAVLAFAQACVGRDPKYIPHPATWLRGGRWDDPAPTAAAGRPSGYVPMGNE